MKKILSLNLLLSLIILAVSSCRKSDPVLPDHTNTIVLPADGTSVIDANNRFAFDFFRATLVSDPENKNKLISPLSIYLALSMVYNGADNATKDSIARTLQISGLDINSLNSVCKTLISQLPKEDNKVQLDIANSIWYRQNSYQPFPAFLDILQTSYEASAQGLNFDDPSSVNTINKWVSQKTNNKIPTIIENISSDDLMYLINAIYFKGSWQHAFKTSDTRNDAFYLQDGRTKSVPFMKQKIRTTMFSNNAFTMIELPYGGGKSFSMYVLKPTNSQQSLNEFSSCINEDVLTDAINKMDSTSIELEIPKWEYSYTIADMRRELSMLGMGISFGEGADFSKMYNPTQVNVLISKAIHKTYIKVNEEGTEAAAVTAFGAGTTSVSMPPIIRLDHPFLYAIIENQTGAVIFLGTIVEP